MAAIPTNGDQLKYSGWLRVNSSAPTFIISLRVKKLMELKTVNAKPKIIIKRPIIFIVY